MCILLTPFTISLDAICFGVYDIGVYSSRDQLNRVAETAFAQLMWHMRNGLDRTNFAEGWIWHDSGTFHCFIKVCIVFAFLTEDRANINYLKALL